MLAWGQIAEPPPETTTIHVLADQIEVPVLAFKPPFRPEPGLTKSQFVIRLDGGTPFHPSHVRMEGAEPLNLIVLVEADTQDAHLLSQSLQSGMETWSPTLFNDSDRVSFYIYGCRLIRSLKEEPTALRINEISSCEQPRCLFFNPQWKGDGRARVRRWINCWKQL